MKKTFGGVLAAGALAATAFTASAPPAEASDCWRVSSTVKGCSASFSNGDFYGTTQFIRLYNPYSAPVLFRITYDDGSATNHCIRNGSYNTYDRGTYSGRVASVYSRTGAAVPVWCGTGSNPISVGAI